MAAQERAGPPRNSAGHRHAADGRKLADGVNDAGTREMMLRMAKEYEMRTEEAERREAPSPYAAKQDCGSLAMFAAIRRASSARAFTCHSSAAIGPGRPL